MKITFNVRTNAEGGRAYFEKDFKPGPAQDAGLPLPTWFQHGSTKLVLPEKPTAQVLSLLLENKDPTTKERLTLRTNTTRIDEGRKTANRRADFELTFSTQKSVSLIALPGRASNVLTAFENTVRSSIAFAARFATARIRKEGICEDRRTGHLLGLLIFDVDSREGDPQLHAHALIANATWDPVERCFKALQFKEILQRISLIQAWGRARLAYELAQLGYHLTFTDGFEVDGVSPGLIRRFSKRTEKIGNVVKEIENRKGEPLGSAGKKLISLNLRAKKNVGDWVQMHSRWLEELGDDGHILSRINNEARERAANRLPSDSEELARKTVARVLDQLFARPAFLSQETILMESLKTAAGRWHGAHIFREVSLRLKNGRLLNWGRNHMIPATRDDMCRLIAKVNASKGTAHPLVDAQTNFSQEDRLLEKICTSSDPILVVTGPRHQEWHATGSKILRQIRDLFTVDAYTVPAAVTAKAGVIPLSEALIDRTGKAGLLVVGQAEKLSMAELEALLDCAGRGAPKILLFAHRLSIYHTLDPTPLGALVRESWLRVVTPPRRLSKKPDKKPSFYRLATALKRRKAKIHTSRERMADDIVTRVVELAQESVTVVVLTDDLTKEAHMNQKIHHALLSAGADHRVPVTTHCPMSPTSSPPEAGQLAVSLRKTRHFAVGQIVKVVGSTEKQVALEIPGQDIQKKVTMKVWKKLLPISRNTLDIGRGTLLTLTADTPSSGLRMGDTVKVKSVQPSGAIRLDDDRTLPPWFWFFRLGYCSTLSKRKKPKPSQHHLFALYRHPTREVRKMIAELAAETEIEVFARNQAILENPVTATFRRLRQRRIYEAYQELEYVPMPLMTRGQKVATKPMISSTGQPAPPAQRSTVLQSPEFPVSDVLRQEARPSPRQTPRESSPATTDPPKKKMRDLEKKELSDPTTIE